MSGACVNCGVAGPDPRCTSCGCVRSVHGYEVAQVLSSRDRGSVYLAKTAAGQPVALKELRFASVPDVHVLEGFEREAEVLQALVHPQVPKFVDSFKDGTGAQTRLYLVQEFVEGETLLARLLRQPFAELEARHVAKQVLGVLRHLHTRVPPLVHRDVKPANLILRPDRTVALVDFGTARELPRGQTHGATLVGTFGYVPLEQLGGTVNASSDLYALGASLVHLMTGRAPETLLTADMELDFQGHLNASPNFRLIVGRLVARDPLERYPSAAAALAALGVGDLGTLVPSAGPTPLARIGERFSPDYVRGVATGAGAFFAAWVMFQLLWALTHGR